MAWFSHRDTSVDRLIRDIRYGVRSFTRSPGLTAVLLVTLAVGTGANATVFSFVDALLFRPAVGVAQPSRLVEIFTSDYSSTPYGNSSYPDYLSMQSVLTSFEFLAVEQNDDIIAIKIGDEAERARVSRVSGDFFAAVGAQPAIGRLLGPNDVVAGATPLRGDWPRAVATRLWIGRADSRNAGHGQRRAVRHRGRRRSAIYRARPRTAAGRLDSARSAARHARRA